MVTTYRYFFVCLFLTMYAPNICFGQQTQSDSLLALFQDEQLADTVRLKSLLDLGASDFARNYPDSIEIYFEVADRLALEQMSPQDQFFYHYHRARALFRAFRYQESLLKVERAGELAVSNQDTVAQIRVLAVQVNCYRDLSDFSAAIEKGTDALLLAEKIGKQSMIGVLHNNIGLVYGQFGEFEKGREHLFLCLKNEQEKKNKIGELSVLTNIGANYSKEGNHEKANEYYLKALAIVEEIDLPKYAGTILLNVGNTYVNLNKMELARAYITRGVAVSRAEKALDAIARGGIQLAHLYRESKPDSALHYAQEALDLAKQLANQTIIKNATEILYQLYEDKGNYKQALAMHKLWKLTLDSVFSEKNRAALYQSEAKYEYENQKLKDEVIYEQGLSAQKLRAQKRFYLLLMASFALFALFVIAYKKRQLRSEQERSALLNEIERLKQRVAIHSIAVEQVPEEMTLDKEKIEKQLGSTVGESSWNILNVIYENPTVSNREIAEQVFLSLEGVSSSLRRMYRTFDVKSGSSSNLKVALITKAIQISFGEKNE